MKMSAISIAKWPKKFGPEKECTKVLAKVHWSQGFQCPLIGSQNYHTIMT